MFFCELLKKENISQCPQDIISIFSFENRFHNDTHYGYQIYNSINVDKLDSFIYNKIIKMNS